MITYIIIEMDAGICEGLSDSGSVCHKRPLSLKRDLSGRAAPGAHEPALDCASCRAPVERLPRDGVAVVASLCTSPLAVSADCGAC